MTATAKKIHPSSFSVAPKMQPSNTKRLTGIAPAILPPQPFNQYHFVDAKTLRRPYVMQNRHTKNPGFFSKLLNSKVFIKLIDSWIYQDIWFVMNKLSIAGLIMGLMFLGAVFFSTGFLAAYKTLPSPTKDDRPAWHAANADQKSNDPSAVGKIAGTIGERYIKKKAGHELSHFAGKEAGIVKHIPSALQPFAHSAQNHANARSNMRINDVGDLTRHNVQKALSGQPSRSQPPVNYYNAPQGTPPQQYYPQQPMPQQGMYPQQQMQQQQMQQGYQQPFYPSQQNYPSIPQNNYYR